MISVSAVSQRLWYARLGFPFLTQLAQSCSCKNANEMIQYPLMNALFSAEATSHSVENDSEKVNCESKIDKSSVKFKLKSDTDEYTEKRKLTSKVQK